MPLSRPGQSGTRLRRLGADKLVYLNDLNFDKNGNPVLFYTTASNASGDAHQPGPFAEPRNG